MGRVKKLKDAPQPPVPYERPITFHRDFYVGCISAITVILTVIILAFLFMEYVV